jgi:sigma-B regulation protein RsbU (phosphoserine phosphatase)
MICLEVIPAGGAPFERLLEEEKVTIGRSSKAGLSIPDPMLSREHARIEREGDRWVLRDLGSHNGTYVNGHRMDSIAVLKEGDVLGLGGTVITVHLTPRTVIEDRGEKERWSEHTLLRPASEIITSEGLPPGADTGNEAALVAALQRLKMLNEVHQALASPMGLAELLTLILDKAFDNLAPEQGAIFLKGSEGSYYCAAARPGGADQGASLYSRHLEREVAEKGMAALVMDVLQDERFAAAQSILGAGVRSILAAPLTDSGGTLGMMVLRTSGATRHFTEEDLELLVSLASVAALRIRNVALAEEAAERRRLENEVALARHIQVGLFPEYLPPLEGYELYGGNIPSRHVSGDLYEVLSRAGGSEVVLFMADVSGKGIGAALLTASLEALAAAPIEAGRQPHEILGRVSTLLYRRTPAAKYATALVTVLEPATGKLRYANAGHPPALVVRANGEVRWLEATGIPVGLLPEFTYGSVDAELAPGDTLLLYTDGLTEAADPDGEDYGQERLRECAVANRTMRPAELARALEEDVDRFVRGRPFADDRTLVVLRRL